MYTHGEPEEESDYLDELNDFATTEKVRMTLFQMLARNQLTQAELMTLALRGLTGLDSFACTSASYDRITSARSETIGGKVWSLIRSDFDEQRENTA